jgi:hypothetical protein
MIVGMLYDFTLVLHIVNACATIAIIWHAIRIRKRKDTGITKAQYSWAVLQQFKVVSGVLMAIA